MNLIEIKILYNADYKVARGMISTKDHIDELLYFVKVRPDVIHVSKTVILPDGEHDDKR